MTIKASCGHILSDDEGLGVPVIYKGESIDYESRCFTRTLVYATFCRSCEAEWRAKGLLFKDEQEANAWLDAV